MKPCKATKICGENGKHSLWIDKKTDQTAARKMAAVLRFKRAFSVGIWQICVFD